MADIYQNEFEKRYCNSRANLRNQELIKEEEMFKARIRSRESQKYWGEISHQRLIEARRNDRP